MISVTTVCGMGLGTSMMLATQIRGLVKEHNIDAKVQPVDLGSFKSQPSDIVVTTTAMADKVSGTKAIVVPIDNLVNKQEVSTKFLAAVEEFNGAQ